jgi:hypothetical protein
MSAYRANTQRVYVILHDDAQELWPDMLENPHVKARTDYFFKDRDTYYGSYLGLAIKTGDVSLIERVVAMSPPEVISVELRTATEYGNMEAIDLLLATGAEPEPLR